MQEFTEKTHQLETDHTATCATLAKTTQQSGQMKEELIKEVKRLGEKVTSIQVALEDKQAEVSDFKVLLEHQKQAADLVYSMLGQVPQDSVGVTLDSNLTADGFPVVSKIDQYGSAAMSLEMRLGDLIQAVDGIPAQGRPVSDIVQILEGPIGSHVIIQARHPDDYTSFVVSLARGAQNHSISKSRHDYVNVENNFLGPSPMPTLSSGDRHSLITVDGKMITSSEATNAILDGDKRYFEKGKAMLELHHAYLMVMAERALRNVCHAAYEHTQAKTVFYTYQSLNPDISSVDKDVQRVAFIRDLAAAKEVISNNQIEYKKWQDEFVKLETKEEMFHAFGAFQKILLRQPFVDARFVAQAKLHEYLRKHASTPEDVLLSFLSLHPPNPFR